ncbi:MAG: recombinase family protein [Deferribacteraceae bacterium]|nr:recombinase family protein [Deferribacteraceae bacterium]
MNAAICARYGSHSRREESTERQPKVCHEFAQRNGYVLTGGYIERTLSAMADNRPQFFKIV